MFLSGNSITNYLEIVYIEGNTIKPIINLSDEGNQSNFPLATDGKSILFIQIYYDDNVIYNQIVTASKPSAWNILFHAEGFMLCAVYHYSKCYAI